MGKPEIGPWGSSSRKSVCLDLLSPGHYQEAQYMFPITQYVKRQELVSILCSRKQGKGTGPHPDSGDLGNPFPDYIEVGGPSWSPCPPADTSYGSMGPSMSVQRPASAFTPCFQPASWDSNLLLEKLGPQHRGPSLSQAPWCVSILELNRPPHSFSPLWPGSISDCVSRWNGVWPAQGSIDALEKLYLL